MKKETWIRPPKSISLDFKELIDYQGLLWSYVRRDISVKYKQTILGFLWVVLQPLILMAIFVVFFSRFLQVPTEGIPAPVFYYSGLIIWTFFATSLANASNSMVANAEVIKKVYFPRLIIPLSSIFVALFDFAISLCIFLVMILGYFLFDPSFEISILQYTICLPTALFITIVTSLGAGTTIGAWNVKYRDFRFIIPFLIQLLMFLTPVIYPVSILETTPWLKYIFSLNPMFLALNLSRYSFMNTDLDLTMVGISLTSMFLIFLYGIYTFKKTERFFADIA